MAILTQRPPGSERDLSVIAAWTSIVGRFPRLLACGVLVVIGLAAAAQASLKPFWYDELANYDIARLPTATAIWNFFASGLDTTGPASTLVEHQVLTSLGSGEVVSRLPAEVGFLLMCLCLYAFVARRYSSGYALSALLLPAMTGVFYYASEMRAYAIVLGCVALALLSWQRAQSPRWRPLSIVGLFLGLSIAVACHSFAVFAVLPFLIAQYVMERETTKRDYAAWIAMLLCPVWFLMEFPGMRLASKTYAGIFWSKPRPRALIESYGYSAGLGWMLAVIVVLIAASLLGKRYATLGKPSEDAGFTRAEWVLAAALALIPVVALPASYALGVYVARYVLPLTLGVVLLVVACVAESLKRNRAAGCLLFALLLLIFLRDQHPVLSQALHARSSITTQFVNQDWVRALDQSPLPVIAPNAYVYLPLQHYAPPDLEQRLYYTSNTPAGMRLDEDRGNQLNMELFAQRIPLRVQDFASFAAQHPQFLVVLDHPLDSRESTGNLQVELLALYRPEPAFGIGYFSIYRVSRQ